MKSICVDHEERCQIAACGQMTMRSAVRSKPCRYSPQPVLRRSAIPITCSRRILERQERKKFSSSPVVQAALNPPAPPVCAADALTCAIRKRSSGESRPQADVTHRVKQRIVPLPEGGPGMRPDESSKNASSRPAGPLARLVQTARHVSANTDRLESSHARNISDQAGNGSPSSTCCSSRGRSPLFHRLARCTTR